MTQVQSRFLNYSPMVMEFLTSKGIKFYVTDADIVCFDIESDSHNDTEFFILGVEYANWLSANANDMTINANGNGSLYHSQ